MLERETINERIKATLPLLSLIALIIGCVLGIVMILALLKLAAAC